MGDFVIGEKLGSGGMGAVYHAHQLSLDRAAALKVLHGRYAKDELYIRDFIREARAAAALNHPNIVQAYAVGDEEDLFYFAMEYVPGKTLKEVLRENGRISSERALDVALQIADALDFSWQRQQLVHRDIKPDNIILTTDGSVKLADLGLARRLAEKASDGTRELYGTPQYIAPEQLLGFGGDNRSDIYSLGATLYHALTGEFPFAGTDPTDIAQKHLTDSLTPPVSLCSEVDTRLSRIVEIMLAKRPWHRYASAAELREDLKAVREGGEPRHPLAVEAQTPIDVSSDEAVDLAEGTTPDDSAGTEGESPVSETRERPTDRVQIITSDDEDAFALPDSTVAGEEEAAEADSSRPRKRLVIAILLALVVLLVAGGAWWTMSRSKAETPGLGGDGKNGGTASAGGNQEDAGAALAALAAKRDAGKPEAEIRSGLRRFIQTHGDESASTEEFLALAAPYREKDLDQARETCRARERQEWEEKARVLAKQAEAEKQKRDAEAAAAEKRRREEEAEKQKATAAARHEALDLAERDKLRWEAVTLCRQQRFSDADALFVPLAVSNNPKESEWAKRKQRCISMAEKLLAGIQNSQKALAGVVLPIPRQRGKWKVARIGFKQVVVENRHRIYRKGKRSEEVKTLDIPITELTAPQMDILTQNKWRIDGRPEKERQLLFAAYLLSRAEYLPEAKKRLEKHGGDEARMLLEEWQPLAAGLRNYEFEHTVKQLKMATEKGDSRRAKMIVAYLRRMFPQECQKNQERLDALMTPK